MDISVNAASLLSHLFHGVSVRQDLLLCPVLRDRFAGKQQDPFAAIEFLKQSLNNGWDKENEDAIRRAISLKEGIRFGLAAIKNVGSKAADEIIRERGDGGNFSSIFDFCQRVDLHKVNKRVVESLIKAGAFDSTGISRAKNAAVMEDAIETGQRVMRDKLQGQLSLFDLVEEDAVNNSVADSTYSYPDIEEWDDKLKLANEREALGFYITGHPLQQRMGEMKRCAVVRIGRLSDFQDQTRVRIGGLVAVVREKRTAKGKLMGFITLEDLTGTVDVTLFPDAFQLALPYIDSQEPLIIEGRVEIDDERAKAKVVATTVMSLKEATGKMVSRVVFALNHNVLTTSKLNHLQGILSRYRGDCPGYVSLKKDDCEMLLSLSNDYRIEPSSELVQEVDALFGCSVVDFET